MTTITHTYNGRTAGAAVGTEEYAAANILGTAPTYVDIGGGDIYVASPTTAVQSTLRDLLSSSGKVLTFAMTMRWASAPTGAIEIMQGRAGTPGSNAKIGNLLTNVSGGNPTLQPRGGADNTALLTGWTSAVTLALNTDYRLDMQVDIGSTGSDGRVRARLVRLSDGVTVAEGSGTGFSNGTAAGWYAAQYLKLAATNQHGLQIDDVVSSDDIAYGTYASDPGAAIVKSVTIADTVSITDFDGVEKTVIEDESLDTVGVTDVLTSARGRDVILADGVTTTDGLNVDRSSAAAGTRADDLAITDNLGVAATRARTFADPVGVTDALLASTGRTDTAGDTVAVTDVLAVSRGRSVTIADNVTVTDLVATLFDGGSEGVRLFYFDGKQELPVKLEALIGILGE